MKGLTILYNEEQGEKSNRKTTHTLRNNKNNTKNTKMINEISYLPLKQECISFINQNYYINETNPLKSGE